MNLIIYITFYQNIKKGAGPIISQPKGSGLPVRKVMIKTYTQGYMHFVHPTNESGMDIHNQLGEAMSYFSCALRIVQILRQVKILLLP